MMHILRELVLMKDDEDLLLHLPEAEKNDADIKNEIEENYEKLKLHKRRLRLKKFLETEVLNYLAERKLRQMLSRAKDMDEKRGKNQLFASTNRSSRTGTSFSTTTEEGRELFMPVDLLQHWSANWTNQRELEQLPWLLGGVNIDMAPRSKAVIAHYDDAPLFPDVNLVKSKTGDIIKNGRLLTKKQEQNYVDEKHQKEKQEQTVEDDIKVVPGAAAFGEPHQIVKATPPPTPAVRATSGTDLSQKVQFLLNVTNGHPG